MASGPGGLNGPGGPTAGYSPGPPPHGGDPEREGLTLRDYIAVMWRRWWIILLVVVVATGSLFYFSYRQPKQYSAIATIIYKQQLDLSNPLNSVGYPDVQGLDREMASINDLLAGSDMQKRVSTLLQKDGVDTQLKYTVTAAQQETQTGTGNAASGSNVVVFTGDSTSPVPVS